MKKMLALMLAALLLAGLLSGCGKSAPAAEPAAAENPAPKEAADAKELAVAGPEAVYSPDAADNARVFYEIFVGSFSDSDGDGIGDLRGIINRFDYLNDGDPNSGRSLGIGGIWLSPIFLSPSYHKYDVTDYYTIDPLFGTEEDLKELADLCEARNVKLILDLPLNHSGAQNQWFADFKAAHRAGDISSPWYDFYSWCGAEENLPGVWQSIPGSGERYECNFSPDMPEFNFDNDDVRQEMLNIAKYYLELGIDGFRFDAAKYVYFGDNARSADFWLWYTGELRAIKPEIYMVAEVWDNDATTDLYYPALNCFNFTMAAAEGKIAKAAHGKSGYGYSSYVQDYLERVTALRADALLLPFISNHDMDRAAGFVTVSSGAMRMAANLYLLGPGSPFLYYGEELGVRGSRGASNTDANRRLAMPWGDGDTVRDPEGSSYGHEGEIPAAEQMLDADSLYSYYKLLIRVRAAYPEIVLGRYEALEIPDTKLVAFVSSWEGQSVCVIHNAGMRDERIALPEGFASVSVCVGRGEAMIENGELVIPAQTSVILR